MDTRMENVRSLTENFKQLQGLRAIPFGLYVLLEAAGRAGWGPRAGSEPLHGLLTLLSIAALALLYFGIGAYYRKTFGVVRAPRKQWGVLELLMWPVLIAMIGLDTYLDLPVNFTFLYVAALFLVPYFRDRRRSHYALLAVVLAVFAFGGYRAEFETGSLGFTVMGFAFVAVGILDHLLLVRALPPAPVEEVAHG